MTHPHATHSPLFALLANLSNREVAALEERTGTDLAAVEAADLHEARMLALEALTMGLLEAEDVVDAITADLAERLGHTYARHRSHNVLGCGITRREREPCSQGEVRVVVELADTDPEEGAHATACVITFWEKDGLHFYGEATLDNASLDDVNAIRTAIDAAMGAA